MKNVIIRSITGPPLPFDKRRHHVRIRQRLDALAAAETEPEEAGQTEQDQ